MLGIILSVSVRVGKRSGVGSVSEKESVKDTISIRVRMMTVQIGNRIETIHLFLQSFNPFWAGDRAVLLSWRNLQIGVRLARGDPNHTPKVFNHPTSEPQKFQIKFLISFKIEFYFLTK